MKNKFTALTIFALFFLYPVTCLLSIASAQTTGLDASYGYNITDAEAQEGDILIHTDQGLMRATSAYSTAIFGVKQSDPLVMIQLSESDTQSIVKSGITQVNVTNTGGPIKKGDYITSSSVTGKGQRADKSGFILGVALTNLEEQTGQIAVDLDIKYVDVYSTISPGANKFLKSLDNILLASTQDPEKFTKLVRYLAASVIMLGAFGISLLTFSKSMSNSVEAIGRNPLARKYIYFSLIINAAVTVTTLLVGFITAFILIKL